jgi:hypothetical protein
MSENAIRTGLGMWISPGRGNYLGVDAACDHDGAATETERSGWYCPECESETAHITCDGCKFLICYVCGYPCACGGDGDGEMFGVAWMAEAESGSAGTGAWVESADEAYATAQAEGLAAADLDEEGRR